MVFLDQRNRARLWHVVLSTTKPYLGEAACGQLAHLRGQPCQRHTQAAAQASGRNPQRGFIVCVVIRFCRFQTLNTKVISQQREVSDNASGTQVQRSRARLAVRDSMGSVKKIKKRFSYQRAQNNCSGLLFQSPCDLSTEQDPEEGGSLPWAPGGPGPANALPFPEQAPVADLPAPIKFGGPVQGHFLTSC